MSQSPTTISKNVHKGIGITIALMIVSYLLRLFSLDSVFLTLSGLLLVLALLIFPTTFAYAFWHGYWIRKNGKIKAFSEKDLVFKLFVLFFVFLLYGIAAYVLGNFLQVD